MKGVVLLTGIPAAGKSTVAQALAERLPRSAHVRGDVFRRMITGGRADMTPSPSAEALRQLRLRYALAASTADAYAAAGFTAILQDVMLGQELAHVAGLIRTRPLRVVVLAPSPQTVAHRDRGRHKTGYAEYPVEALDAGLREHTPRLGLWLDTSAQTPPETVGEILARAQEALVPGEDQPPSRDGGRVR